MKKSELVKLIRQVVREELKNTKKSIKSEVKKQINEIFIKEGVKSVFSERASSSSDSLSDAFNPNLDKQSASPKSKPKPAKNYTSNPVLNDILNETKGGIESEYSKEVGDEYPNMMNKMFTTEDLHTLAPNGTLDDKKKLEIGAVQTIKAIPGATTDSVPEGVLNNLTRNYRDVLEKSVQISKNKKGQF